INAMVAAVRERTQELEDRNRQLLDARALASTDGLTGVLNHRAFQERIRALVAAASKTAPVSLIMLDLDGFKQIVEEGTEAANVTVSLGVASYPLTASSADELTYQADAAMYTAKS